MAQEVLLCISLIIALAGILSILARMIKQPPLIAYLIAGVLAGPLFFNILGGDSSSLIQVFAHIGVAFLLFIVGLNLDLRVLKEVGGVSVVAGLSEIFLTGLIGFILAIGFGFANMTALYIGAALAFSSTVVVVKILSDKKEIDTLHGRIALGILIVEDFVAAIALMAIPLFNSNGSITSVLMWLSLAIGVIIAIFLFSHFVLKGFLNYLARSQETLFLFGITWALSLATLFDWLGFSLEIGALIAGMSLATSKYTLELGGKMKPLRDFFVVLFFVFFGSQLAGSIDWPLIKTALIFSAFIVIGKPLIVMTVLRLAGYKKRTNFLTGTSIAQISEFSLILVLLGYTLGHLTQEVMSLAVLIAIITIGVSSYSIYYSHSIFNKLSYLLGIFEGKKHEKKNNSSKESYEIVLFGAHRIGYKILKTLKEMKVPFVVIDYNPKTILTLGKQGINCIYGDASDKEFLNEIELSKVKVVVSTIPDEYSNLAIRENLDRIKSDAVFIATSEQPTHALDLYSQGVDYVIIPHHLGGDYAAHMIRRFGTAKKDYKEAGKKHRKDLNEAKNSVLF